MAKLIYLRLFTIFLFSFSYNSFAADGFSISATIETPQVAINGNADDPAIWLNQEDPSLSIVFGTDKYNGIYSYNLKGEIIGFSKSIAQEIGSRNIRCNVIAPGFIKTEMTDKLSDSLVNSRTENIPLKRAGESLDVANLCLFLASDLSSYITGQVIHVDGGLLT